MLLLGISILIDEMEPNTYPGNVTNDSRDQLRPTFWPIDTRSTRRLIYDYYWPHLSVLWKPSCPRCWTNAVELVSEFKNLKYPIPWNLVLIAALRGLVSIRQDDLQAIAICQEILAIALIEPKTLSFGKASDIGSFFNKIGCSETNKISLESAKRRMKGPMWYVAGWEPINLKGVFGMQPAADRICRKPDLEPAYIKPYIAACEVVANWMVHTSTEITDPEEIEHMRDRRTARVFQKGIVLKEISIMPWKRNDFDSNCIICRQPLANAEDLDKIFATANETFAKGGVFVPADEAWSDAQKKRDVKDFGQILIAYNYAMERMTQHTSFEHYARAHKIIQAYLRASNAIRDLERAYYHLKAARETYLPEDVCLEPVELTCGHNCFGRQCISRWIAGKLQDAMRDEWMDENTKCPYCKQNIQGFQSLQDRPGLP